MSKMLTVAAMAIGLSCATLPAMAEDDSWDASDQFREACEEMVAQFDHDAVNGRAGHANLTRARAVRDAGVVQSDRGNYDHCAVELRHALQMIGAYPNY